MNKFLIILLLFALYNKAMAQEDAIYISNDGKVGIGTSAPKADLDIKGNAKINGSMTVQGNVVTPGTIQVSGKIMEKGHDLVPKGTIIMWYPDSLWQARYGHLDTPPPPPGWAFCNGQIIQNSQNGKKDTIPNLQGRFLMGTDKPENLGKTGGSELVEFKADNIPTHYHYTKNRYVVQNYSTRNFATTSFLNLLYHEGVIKHISSYDIQTTEMTNASSIKDENRPPYQAIYYIIKI
jgi:microcystin-dependent protein